MPPRRPAGVAATIATALLLAACGGGGEAPEVTPTATPRPAAATPTVEPPTPEAVAAATPTPACPDPYPDGSPYTPEPGEPIRVQPPVRPPALERFMPPRMQVDEDLEELVLDVLDDDAEHVSVVVKELASGRGMTHRPDERYYAASLFKTWVMLEAYHQSAAGLLRFDEVYVVSDHYAGGSLNAGELELCQRVTVDEALRRMIAVSDNVAAGLLLDRAGVANTNAAIAALGLASSSVAGDGSLPTTAADMALLLEAIAARRAVSPEASDAMLLRLATEAVDDRLPALLPEGTTVAHKTGSWTTATHDAGIVYSPGAAYVIVVLTDFGFESEPRALIARLSRAVYDHYN